jgi:hypothetical protein
MATDLLSIAAVACGLMMIVFVGCDEGGVKALKSSSSSRRGGGKDAYCAACGGLIDLGTMLHVAIEGG